MGSVGSFLPGIALPPGAAGGYACSVQGFPSREQESPGGGGWGGGVWACGVKVIATFLLTTPRGYT